MLNVRLRNAPHLGSAKDARKALFPLTRVAVVATVLLQESGKKDLSPRNCGKERNAEVVFKAAGREDTVLNATVSTTRPLIPVVVALGASSSRSTREEDFPSPRWEHLKLLLTSSRLRPLSSDPGLTLSILLETFIECSTA